MALTPPAGGQAAPTAVAPVAPPNTYAALYTAGPTGATGLTGPQGPIGPGNATSPTVLTANNAAEIPLTIKGAASQSAYLTAWQNSAGSLVARITPIGDLQLASNLACNAGYFSTVLSGLVQNVVADGASTVGIVLNNGITLVNPGAKLLSVRNNGTEKLYVDPFGAVYAAGNIVTSGGSYATTFLAYTGAATVRGQAADGASAVGSILDTANTFATAGAKLLSVRNNGVEKAYADKDGGIYSVASGGLNTGTNSGIRLQTCDEVLLVNGPNVPFANSYAATYNADGTISYETWTDSGNSRLRRRLDYTYSAGQASTIRTRVYSADDGTTVVADMTETLTYSGGKLSSSSSTRSV